MYIHIHHKQILQLGRVKDYMLVNPRALSSSPTEHHPSSLTEPPCYFIKSSVTRLSFSWNTQYSLSQRSHPASGCCLSVEACSLMYCVDCQWIWNALMSSANSEVLETLPCAQFKDGNRIKYQKTTAKLLIYCTWLLF